MTVAEGLSVGQSSAASAASSQAPSFASAQMASAQVASALDTDVARASHMLQMLDVPEMVR